MFDTGALVRKVMLAIVPTMIAFSTAQSAELPPGAVPRPPGFQLVPNKIVKPKGFLPTDYEKGQLINKKLKSAGSISFDITIAELEELEFKCKPTASEDMNYCSTPDATAYTLLGRPAKVYVVLYQGLVYSVKYTIPASHSEVKEALTTVYGWPFKRIAYRGEPLKSESQYIAWIFSDGAVVDIYSDKSNREVGIKFHTPLYTAREYEKQLNEFGLEPFGLDALDLSDL